MIHVAAAQPEASRVTAVSCPVMAGPQDLDAGLGGHS